MFELLVDVRRNVFVILAKAAILAVFFVAVASSSSFSASTDAAVATGFGPDAGRNLYTVTDTLVDGAFEDFRHDPASVATVGAFYDELNSGSDIRLVSAFAQPIVVADFRGGDRFDPRSDSDIASPGETTDPRTGRTVRDIRSIQMNRDAFEFAGLQVADGQTPDWDSVDYSGGKIPVVLGNSYRKLYQLGDELESQYYGKEFALRVTGFLAADASMYYKGDLDYFLDDYVVIPYPHVLPTAPTRTSAFMGILAFAMINSDLAASTSLTSADVISYLDSVAVRSGFHDYALIDVPQYLTQFSLTRSLLLDNARLVGVLLITLALVVVIIVSAASVSLFRRRLPALTARWVVGSAPRTIQSSLASMVLCEWAVILAVFATITGTFPTRDSAASSTVPLLILACAVVDVVLVGAALRRRIRRGGLI